MPVISGGLTIPFTLGEGEAASSSGAPITTQTLDVSIRLEALDGTCETCGADRAIDVLPETVVLSANEWGPDKASFVLRRSPWAAWPDLLPFTPVEVEVGGVVVWDGRTNGTPLKAGAEQQISVQCEGWQYHLDDDLYKRVYVHATLTDWKDVRSSPEGPLAYFPATPQVQAEAGVITLTQPKGSTGEAGKSIGVILDLGEACATKIVVTLGESTFHGTTGWQLYCRGMQAVSDITYGPYENGWTAFELETASNTVHVGSFAGPFRYVALFAYREGTTYTATVDEYVKITGVSVFSEATYEATDVSVLKASTVIRDALERATMLLSEDYSQINTAEDLFDIPTLAMSNEKTPRQMAEAVNAYHDWTTKVDLSRRMVFQPRASEPLFEFGSWSGEEIEDASAGEGSEVVDRVIVEGATAEGNPLDVVVTSLASPTEQQALEEKQNVVARRGFRRTKAVSLSNATTEAAAKKLGEVYLAGQLSTPFAGSIKAAPGSVRMVLGGQPVHPSVLVRHAESMIRVSHAIDPNTGGIGRDARMVAVTYTHATQMAEISLDNRLDNYEALVQRLQVTEEVGS